LSARELLADYLASMRDREFAYGSFDCALFGADWVKQCTGVDYAQKLRGYSSPLEAYRIVRSYGSIEAMITTLLGREPIAPAQAMRGDIVLASLDSDEGEARDTIGICEVVHCFFPAHPRGLIARPRSVARLAWSIE
jgi:hypothetical protein